MLKNESVKQCQEWREQWRSVISPLLEIKNNEENDRQINKKKSDFEKWKNEETQGKFLWKKEEGNCAYQDPSLLHLAHCQGNLALIHLCVLTIMLKASSTSSSHNVKSSPNLADCHDP